MWEWQALIVRMVAGIGTLAMVVSSVAAADSRAADSRLVAYGRHLAQECTSCHRLDGVDNGIPSIVGRDPALFMETIEYYRNGARSNAAMVSVAQSLDDEQVKALAEFYATIPAKRPQRKTP